MEQINSFESSINSEIQEVKDKYFGTEKWMKAPNGEDTRLNESQWLFVRTQNFKSWFGDWESDSDFASKAIDNQTTMGVQLKLISLKVWLRGLVVNMIIMAFISLPILKWLQILQF